ncbi:hypothetical protein MesoLj113a_21520 [Mesorhizobium sp. 113-1-2]|nr:hypothetical protein MesoLj113a_21520 [Mesorhizobium sp. 113-1-2]
MSNVACRPHDKYKANKTAKPCSGGKNMDDVDAGMKSALKARPHCCMPRQGKARQGTAGQNRRKSMATWHEPTGQSKQ